LVRFLEKNPQHWHANHNLVVKEIENVNKIKMVLIVFHTINFQDIGEKTRRRTELVMEIKKIFEELNIRYNLPPQAVHDLKQQMQPTDDFCSSLQMAFVISKYVPFLLLLRI